MKEIGVPAIRLFIISAVCALLLGFCSELTKPAIAEQTKKTQDEAMQAVLPEADSFALDEAANLETELSTTQKIPISSVNVGTKGGEVVGYVINVQPSGFGGVVDTMVGIGVDGEIKGLKVLSHSETPGLGAKSTEPAFYEQFTGKTSAPLTVIKSGTPGDSDIQAITSATITSTAVTNGANVAYDWYVNNGGAK